ncbi:MAG: flagellar basal body P-ring formation protein FlgA [Gammaproteobacteria bacterium]|nr:flagellar basal body P-ring formation protein FlgA [Gammaproteobacteria bacterium]
MRLPLLIWSLLITGLIAFPLAAGQLQSHESIRAAAHQHALSQLGGVKEADITIHPAELDRRLRLPRCNQPLESFSPTSRKSGFRQTVGIRCDGKNRWTLYVSVKVEVNKNILVARHRLGRGAIISKGDFKLEKRMVSKLHRGYVEKPENAVGKTLKQALKRGDALIPGQLKIPSAIKRGSQVTILGRAGGVEVRMSGKALSDGIRGQRIKVRNNSSNRQIEATVIARGTVEVTL